MSVHLMAGANNTTDALRIVMMSVLSVEMVSDLFVYIRWSSKDL